MWKFFRTALIHFLKVSTARRLLTLFILIILFLLFDYFIGYTSKNLTDNQIKQSALLQKQIDNPKTDSLNRVVMIEKQREILQEEHYESFLSNSFLYLKKSFFHSKTESPTVSKTIYINNNVPKYSIFPIKLISINYFTSAWVFLFIIFAILLVPFSANRISFLKIFSAIFLSFILLIFSLNISILCSLIPTIFNRNINYLLNLIIGIVIPAFTVYSMGVFSTIIDYFVESNNIELPKDDERITDYIQRLKQTIKRP